MGFGMGFGIWDGIWGWDGNGIWDLGWDGNGIWDLGWDGIWAASIGMISGQLFILSPLKVDKLKPFKFFCEVTNSFNSLETTLSNSKCMVRDCNYGIFETSDEK